MPDQSPNPLQNGDVVLDRYRVERGIAQGGHSLVYRGLDERLSRPVCIKAFHKLANEQGIWETAYEHFVQEAFALSKLGHPNTLRIYDFGHLEPLAPSGGTRVPVQISEYMGGGTLGSVVHNHAPMANSATLLPKRTGSASCIETSSRKIFSSQAPGETGSQSLPTSASPSRSQQATSSIRRKRRKLSSAFLWRCTRQAGRPQSNSMARPHLHPPTSSRSPSLLCMH